jgi:hypothetical protein
MASEGMKSARSRSTRTGSSWTPRLSRSPRVTVVLILDEDSDVSSCVARLASHCERSGADGVIVTATAALIDETAVGRRVRLVTAPADVSRGELRHLAMQHADGDIVLLEDVSSTASNVAGAFSIRDLSERTRVCAPISEWRDILLAHGIADMAPVRPSPRQLLRVEARSLREALSMPADAHHPA